MGRLEQLQHLKELYQMRQMGYHWVNQQNQSLKGCCQTQALLAELIEGCHLCRLAKTSQTRRKPLSDVVDLLILSSLPLQEHYQERLEYYLQEVCGEVGRIGYTTLCKCGDESDAQSIQACEPFLHDEILFAKPKALLILGTCGDSLLPRSERLGNLGYLDGMAVVTTLELDHLVRNPSLKGQFIADLQTLRMVLQ